MQETLGLSLRNHFSEKSQVKLLEIGAGNGITTQHVLDQLPFCNILSLDNERQMIEQAKQNVTSRRACFKFANACTFLQRASYKWMASLVRIHCIILKKNY